MVVNMAGKGKMIPLRVGTKVNRYKTKSDTKQAYYEKKHFSSLNVECKSFSISHLLDPFLSHLTGRSYFEMAHQPSTNAVSCDGSNEYFLTFRVSNYDMN